MSDSVWLSSSVSGDDLEDESDMNSSGNKQIDIYVDEQLRKSLSVCKTLSQNKQKGEIYAILSDVLFDDQGDTDIILDSVQITTTPEAKPVATDELQKYASDNDLFAISVSKLLAMNTESEITLWFMTPAGRARAASAKRRRSSDCGTLPLDQEFVRQFTIKIAEAYMPSDLTHSKIYTEVGTCLLTHILGSKYHDIAKEALRAYRANLKPRMVDTKSKTARLSATGSASGKDIRIHNTSHCLLLGSSLQNLAIEIRKLKEKQPMNHITMNAIKVYGMLYGDQDDATPDLPSQLKDALLIDM